jgi:hypothetical protein
VDAVRSFVGEWRGTLIAAAAVIAFNVLAYRSGSPHGDWSGTFNQALDDVFIVLVVAVLVVVSYLVHSGRERGRAKTLCLGVPVWAAAPAALGFALWDESRSTSVWWSTTWYWALDPLPFDISGPTGWLPAVSDPTTAQAIPLILMQVATIALVVSAIAVGISEWRTSRRELVEPETLDTRD